MSAGRGRGATLPAWMTHNSDMATTVNAQSYGEVNKGFSKSDSHVEEKPRPINNERSRELERYRDINNDSHRIRDREDRDKRSKSRERKSSKRSRSRSRSRDRRRRETESAPESKSRGWKPKKTSNFDIKPPDGVVLPPISVQSAQTAEMNKLGFQPQLGLINNRDNSVTTKHARTVYVGNIPNNSLEQEISAFFNDICYRGLPKRALPTDGMPPVMKVYLNLDKCFAFVEFPTMEIADAAMKLDGITFMHSSGSHIIRIRRPRDYRPEGLPKSDNQLDFNLPEFQVVSTAVTDGPGKVFVGGLPYHLTDEQVKELLSAFGRLKAFNLVRDPGSALSKGYGFCEYFDDATTQLAIMGLNEMAIGEKKLTVRIADMKGGNIMPGSSVSQAIASNPLLGQIPTKVLRLENMVTSEELQDDEEYDDILTDVHQECSQYGSVDKVVIPRAKSGFPKATEGCIFVSFQDVNSSINAAMKLYGRKFVDRTVMVNYFDELNFRNQLFN